MPICPKCRRSLGTPGFCPYDGTALVDELRADTPPPQRPQVVIHSHSTDAGGPREDPYARLIGQTLEGRYLIEARLGEGGMGVVYRARHVVIEKAVAIKVLKREVARDVSVVRRFVQEARAASRIGHPNIVDVTDFGSTPDGMTYQVMEYIEGQTLSAVLRREQRMPPSRILPIIAQLCRALGAAHDKGIVHRDLKPENVFLIDRDGRHDFVKVVDFGIAKVQPIEGGPNVPRLTRAGSVFGTPEYMAPEQAQGKGDTDLRVDIYAIGTILYEALVGTVPHKGETAIRTLAMQLMDPILPPRQVLPGLAVSDALEAVVMKALAKERDARYQTTQEVLDALASVAGDVAMDQPLSASTGSHAALIDGPATIREPATADGLRLATGSTAGEIPIELVPKRSKRPSAGLFRRSKPPTARQLARSKPPTGQEVPPAQVVVPDATPVHHQSGHGMVPGLPALAPSDVRRTSEAPAGQERRPRRWAALLVGLLLLCGAGALLAFALVNRSGGESRRVAAGGGDAGAGTRNGSGTAAVHDAGTGAGAGGADAGAAATTGRDAGAVRVSVRDPGNHHPLPGSHRDPQPDAAPTIASKMPVPIPVSTRADAGVDEPRQTPGGPDLEVTVVTDPAGGRLLASDTGFGGTDGTTFRRPAGEVITFTCRQYSKDGKVVASGKVQVKFRRDRHMYICRMQPVSRRKCVEGVKNPFDDCDP